MESTPGPVSAAARLELLDVLRGVAMLGIFVVNLWSFAMPPATYLNPTAFGSLEGLNGLAWLVVYLLFDSKFITLFSFLFGAGLVIMTSRADATTLSPWPRHLRRTGALLGIGLAHAYLLWWGDVLAAYAICGLLVFIFRRGSPRRQLIIGVGLLVVPSLLYFASYAGWATQLEGEALQKEVETWAPSPETIESQIAVMQGGWLEQMALRVPEAAMLHAFVLPFYLGWRISGTMLIGMALYQGGMLSGKWDAKRYLQLAAVCLPLGLVLVGTGIGFNAGAQWAWAESLFLYSQFNYFGSIITALGYIGVVGYVIASGMLRGLRKRLAAVGRIALTCYLGQTLIATTLFFGHGFGLYGEVSRVGQFTIFLLVSALQLALAPIWLRHFRQGPLEWLLRGVVYGRFSNLRVTKT
jgi:uncharacterized protein